MIVVHAAHRPPAAEVATRADAAVEGSATIASTEDLYGALLALRDAQSAAAETNAKNQQLERKTAERAVEAAERRAQEAAHKGGFFDAIAKDIGLAGVAGLVTFQYAAVAADVLAHETHLVDKMSIDVIDLGAVATGKSELLLADLLLRKTDLPPKEARAMLERAGLRRDAPGITDDDVKPVAKKILMANIAIASATATVLSAGSATPALTLALAGVALSFAGQKLAESKALDGILGRGASDYVGLGLEIYGAAASVAAGGVHGGDAGVAASAIEGATSGARGADEAVLAGHRYTEDEAEIDASRGQMKLDAIERFVDLVIDGLKATESTLDKASETVAGVIQMQQETRSMLIEGGRG